MKKKTKKRIKKLEARIKALEDNQQPTVRQIGFDYLYNYHYENEYDDE
jgi:BMFP domain-containing protein YqiC